MDYRRDRSIVPPAYALRELGLLKSVGGHENVVKLLDFVFDTERRCITAVLQPAKADLKRWLDARFPDKAALPAEYIRGIMECLLSGLSFLHNKSILHRDIKPSNVLIFEDSAAGTCSLQLTDFGLSRVKQTETRKNRKLTHEVVTLWYRAPEIILGAPSYTESIDVWSSACVLAEILRRKPLIYEEHEISCVIKILRLCGSPDADALQFYRRLPYFSCDYPKFGTGTLVTSLPPWARNEALDLLKAMMALLPSRHGGGHG